MSKKFKILVIIPARFKSSRFPGKPLAKIKNIEMVIRVAKICQQAVGKSNVIIATDHFKINQIGKKYGYSVKMTSKKCSTGTDRLAEVSSKIKANIYINVQGDEPLVKSKDIKKVISAKIKFPKYIICGYTDLGKSEKVSNLNIPKVLKNHKNDLIYMSRLPIPGRKNIKKNIETKFYKQVCIYAFNREDLKQYKKFGKKSAFEILEDIEILRFFEIGKKIKMVKTSSQSIAVDLRSDIKKVEKYLKNNQKN